MTTAAPTPEPCRPLPWDTEFFGISVARVQADALTDPLCAAIDHWCARHQVACLYFLARSDDAPTPRLAAQHGFILTDVRMTLDRAITAAQPAPPDVRAFAPDDLPALQRIARYSFRDSRFYYDGHFPPERCDDLYETWTTRDCRAPGVWVAVRHAQPVGFVTCTVDANHHRGAIELIGVETAWQRQGVGADLVQAALAYFAGQGVTACSVVTQGRNLAAQRLYQRLGFTTRSVQLYYHKWYGR